MVSVEPDVGLVVNVCVRQKPSRLLVVTSCGYPGQLSRLSLRGG